MATNNWDRYIDVLNNRLNPPSNVSFSSSSATPKWYAWSIQRNLEAVQSAWLKAEQDKAAEKLATAQTKSDIKSDINEKTLTWLKANQDKFKQTLDEARDQQRISLEAQRRIADQFREAVWVEAFIANSKVWPWMSESQKLSLANDIQKWYLQSVAQAEWNFEQVRLNTSNKLVELWVQEKESQDIIEKLERDYGIEAAEPILNALTEISNSKSELIDKIFGIQSGLHEWAIEDSQNKLLTQEAMKQRQAEYEAATPAAKMDMIRSIPWSDTLLELDPNYVQNLINNNTSWAAIFNAITAANNKSDQAAQLVLAKAQTDPYFTFDQAITALSWIGQDDPSVDTQETSSNSATWTNSNISWWDTWWATPPSSTSTTTPSSNTSTPPTTPPTTTPSSDTPTMWGALWNVPLSTNGRIKIWEFIVNDSQNLSLIIRNWDDQTRTWAEQLRQTFQWSTIQQKNWILKQLEDKMISETNLAKQAQYKALHLYITNRYKW